jgi:hypothetical protein
MYYIFNPIWKDNTRPGKARFVGDNSICYTKFKSIEDGVLAAKLDQTALRESNWEIWECRFLRRKKPITLASLRDLGYLSDKMTIDEIGIIYYAKES